MFLVQHVMALVGLHFFTVPPYSVTVPVSLLEIANIFSTVHPFVLSIALTKTVDEFSLVRITICVFLDSTTVFESIFEVTDVNVT